MINEIIDDCRLFPKMCSPEVKWNYGSTKTWGYMLGGVVVGGISGWAGGASASSGIPMANTLGIMSSSLIYSVGTNIYTDGRTPISISFGFASYDFTNDKWSTFSKNNEWYENMAYAFGAMANLSDVVSLFGGGINVDLIVEKKDAISHSALVNEQNGINISVGPYKELGEGINMNNLKSGIFKGTLKELKRKMKGRIWTNHAADGKGSGLTINNVNKKILSKISKNLQVRMDDQSLLYNLMGKSCVGYTSKALWAVGVPSLGGIHPYWLQFQMMTRQAGIYSSPYLYQM